MSRNVLIVPDKFKGTLTAQAAAAAIADGWRKIHPADTLTQLPMSDGGDGFGQVISDLIGAKAQKIKTVNAAHEPIEAHWWWHAASKTAIVESARIVGLAMLPPSKHHPFTLDTYGLGAVLRAAEKKGALRCVVGIGGSATNDGGFGMAQALGFKFTDRQGQSIENWMDMPKAVRVTRPKTPLRIRSITVAVDVNNPLLGQRGCSRVYGPQKGLRPEDMLSAEKALRKLGQLAKQVSATSDIREPGVGAAGGLGFGLRAFTTAKLKSGFAIFAEHADLNKRIRKADLVITAEGAIDQQTLMGKGVGEVANVCRKHGVPCIGLAGSIPTPELLAQAQKRFAFAFAITTHLTNLKNAKAEPAKWLTRLGTRAAESWEA